MTCRFKAIPPVEVGIRIVLTRGMTHTLVGVSPFNCRWIHQESEGQPVDSRYAICLRPPKGPRVVCKAECEQCHAWQPSDGSGCACPGTAWN